MANVFTSAASNELILYEKGAATIVSPLTIVDNIPIEHLVWEGQTIETYFDWEPVVESD